MPRYDYVCTKCWSVKEVGHKFDETPIVICDNCPYQMSKQLGTFSSFRFKGPGFFRNDYPKGK